jgi:hypothetical protein
MKNIDWTSFTTKIAVNSKMSTLYDAWTKASEIEKWFLSNADYFDENKNLVDKENHIQKNYTYRWSWYLYDIVEEGKITEVNGIDRIQFTFAGDCLVTVQLTEFKDYIIVELTQKNIPTDDESKVNVRLGCHTGWSFYLVNLKSVYEGACLPTRQGLDLRNKDPELKGMLNV